MAPGKLEFEQPPPKKPKLVQGQAVPDPSPKQYGAPCAKAAGVELPQRARTAPVTKRRINTLRIFARNDRVSMRRLQVWSRVRQAMPPIGGGLLGVSWFRYGLPRLYPLHTRVANACTSTVGKMWNGTIWTTQVPSRRIHRMKRILGIDFISLVGVFALYTLSSCACIEGSGKSSCGESLSSADRDAISANSASWLRAMRAADWKAVVATYTNDALLMPPNEPAVSGKPAMLAWFSAFPPLESFDLQELEVEGCCDTAFVRGSYQLAMTIPGTGVVRDKGKYIEIHKKQANGAWLKLRDMFSSDEPVSH